MAYQIIYLDKLNVWKAIIEPELDIAESQGIKNAKKTGVVLAIKRNGKVIRRGVGKPIWKELLEEFAKK